GGICKTGNVGLYSTLIAEWLLSGKCTTGLFHHHQQLMTTLPLERSSLLSKKDSAGLHGKWSMFVNGWQNTNDLLLLVHHPSAPLPQSLSRSARDPQCSRRTRSAPTTERVDEHCRAA